VNSNQVIEIIAAASGLLYVIGAAFEKIWCWPVGIVNLIFYAIYCYELPIYGELSLSGIYLILTLWGWYRWNLKTKVKEAMPRRSTSKEVLIQALLMLILAIAYVLVLAGVLQSKFPRLDACLVSGSIIATIMTARKQIENWLLWIPINLGYIYMFYMQQSIPLIILYSIYLIMSILGWKQWKKNLIS